MQPNMPQMPVGMQPQAGNTQQPGQIPMGMYAQPKKRINLLIVPVVVLSVLFIATTIFAFWAFSGMQDYKKNSDKKSDAAVTAAKEEISTQKDREFVEKEKNPYKYYEGPDTFGSTKFSYPKTWAAFITESKEGGSGTALNGYIHPDFVPGLQSGTDFALRFQVASQPYSDIVKQYESKVKQGKLVITPYKADKVPSVLGVRIVGEINQNQKDNMVILPLRDKTLLIWTESIQYLNDFDKVVLPSLSFVP